MTPRDYELEAATAAVEHMVTEPVERAVLVGPPGSEEGTLGGSLKSWFGRSRRAAGLASRDALVLTPTSIRLFACSSHGWPPVAEREVAVWKRDGLQVVATAAEKWSAFNASHSGSVTNRYYRITLTPAGSDTPVIVECPRTDSARATILALEDATGSPPSRITARRRKKQAAPPPDHG